MKELSIRYIRTTINQYICQECNKKVKGIYLIRKGSTSKHPKSIWICPYCFNELIKELW